MSSGKFLVRNSRRKIGRIFRETPQTPVGEILRELRTKSQEELGQLGKKSSGSNLGRTTNEITQCNPRDKMKNSLEEHLAKIPEETIKSYRGK